jgi:hypothetical protein
MTDTVLPLTAPDTETSATETSATEEES